MINKYKYWPLFTHRTKHKITRNGTSRKITVQLQYLEFYGEEKKKKSKIKRLNYQGFIKIIIQKRKKIPQTF